MKNLFLSFFLLCFMQPLFSQVKTQNFESKILQQYRNIKIYVPKSYEQDSTKVYPLAVVLDAQDLFDIYVANSKLLARKQEAPEQIIVGIPQLESRTEDCAYDKGTSLPVGFSKDFKDFIDLELLPNIDDTYRLSPFKVIVGRSLTANFINYFFIDDQPIFNAFINLNPSYADGMASFVRNKIPNLSIPTYYYMSSGSFNSEEKQKRINGMYSLIKTYNNPFLNYKLVNYNEVTYTASLGMAIPNALAFIYKVYGPISKEEYNTKISKMSPPEAITYLEKKYVEIEYFFGTNIKIRLKDILRIEPMIIEKDDGDYLNEFGKMILRIYPNSALGYYYIGLYYETGRRYKKALKYYKIGYSKIDQSDPNLDAYYENIDRVIKKKLNDN
jgi:predicted alpha/beta superfamily hydrolase